MKIKKFSLRIEEDILKKLHIIAEHEKRSVNKQIVHFLRQAVWDFEDED